MMKLFSMLWLGTCLAVSAALGAAPRQPFQIYDIPTKAGVLHMTSVVATEASGKLVRSVWLLSLDRADVSVSLSYAREGAEVTQYSSVVRSAAGGPMEFQQPLVVLVDERGRLVVVADRLPEGWKTQAEARAAIAATIDAWLAAQKPLPPAPGAAR